MLVCVLLNTRDFRPRVHPELNNKNPKASTYQSSAKVKEGLTLHEERISDTIRYCDMDEG
jgi:hypothetical protein